MTNIAILEKHTCAKAETTFPKDITQYHAWMFDLKECICISLEKHIQKYDQVVQNEVTGEKHKDLVNSSLTVQNTNADNIKVKSTNWSVRVTNPIIV
jgi:hypothetical protein